MKTIEQYISGKHVALLTEHILKGHLQKQQKHIDWKWRGKALSNNEMREYQNIIKIWAEKKYGTFTPEIYLNIIKTYYIVFLNCDDKVKTASERANKNNQKMIHYAEKFLPQKGISWFDNNYMGQGWFDFMNYAITNKFI